MSTAWAAAHEATATAEALRTIREMEADKEARQMRARRVEQVKKIAQQHQNKTTVRAQELRLMALSRKGKTDG